MGLGEQGLLFIGVWGLLIVVTLLWSTDSRHMGFSNCSCRLSSCGAQAYLLHRIWNPLPDQRLIEAMSSDWQEDSWPLEHQGSPRLVASPSVNFLIVPSKGIAVGLWSLPFHRWRWWVRSREAKATCCLVAKLGLDADIHLQAPQKTVFYSITWKGSSEKVVRGDASFRESLVIADEIHHLIFC